MLYSRLLGETIPALGTGCPVGPIRFPELLHPSELLPLPPPGSTAQVHPLEPQLCALLLALVPALWCLGPRYVWVVTAQAGTDEHIPDQLFLVGHDQVPVSIPPFHPPGSSAEPSLQDPPRCWSPAALPAHECQGSYHFPREPAHWPGHFSRLLSGLFCQLSLVKQFLNCQDSVPLSEPFTAHSKSS